MVNTLLYPAGTWVNGDGLQVNFPGSGLRDAVVGSTRLSGDTKELIADIDWHHLPAFSANEQTGCIYGGLSQAGIPAGALIIDATVLTTEVFTSTGSSTMSLGLVQGDGTELDNDGLVDAIAKTSMDAVGETTAGAGALVGTILAATANMYYLWATVQVATFTAGKARFRVTYLMPTTNTPGAVPA